MRGTKEQVFGASEVFQLPQYASPFFDANFCKSHRGIEMRFMHLRMWRLKHAKANLQSDCQYSPENGRCQLRHQETNAHADTEATLQEPFAFSLDGLQADLKWGNRVLSVRINIQSQRRATQCFSAEAEG